MLVNRLARLALWGPALAAVAIFLFLVSRRLFYPLELDYIEGAIMDHVIRLTRGEPIYVAPSLEFVTLAYMPGFATVASLLARVFGPELWVPRLVSVLAMLGTTAIVVTTLRRETGSWTLAAAGAGLLHASFGVTGGHYDVARPDSLMLFLSFAGLATLRFSTGHLAAIASALLLSAAFFTKQHAVWFVIASLLHLAVNDRMRLWSFAPVAVAACAGGYFALGAWLGPWFQYFTWEVPSHWSSIDKVRILNYVGKGLVGTFGYLTFGVLASLALPDRVWRGAQGLWWWVGLGALATGGMATLDPDAFRHVMNPSVVALSILGPLALSHVMHHVAHWPGARRDLRPAMLWIVLGLQFLPLAYTVRGQMPRPRAAEARAAMLERFRDHDGPVLMLYHGYFSWLAGKGSTFQQIALDDIIRARGNRLLREDPQVVQRIFDRLVNEVRPMIVTDVALERSGIESRPYWEAIASHYVLADSLGWVGETFNPIDGNHWTPRYVYVPRALAPAADGAAADTAAADSALAAPAEGTRLP